MAAGGGGAIPSGGLSPLQRTSYWQGKKILAESMPFADVAATKNLQWQQRYNRALRDQIQFGERMNDYTNQQAQWARGGLMAAGLNQLDQSLAGPDLAPGIQARQLGRMGITATPMQQRAIDQQNALAQASGQIGLSNRTRQGLSLAQRNLRFGGM